jgi:hypothetical protein
MPRANWRSTTIANFTPKENWGSGEQKEDWMEGAVTGCPLCKCMSHQDTLAPLIPMGYHPISHPTPQLCLFLTFHPTTVKESHAPSASMVGITQVLKNTN